MHLPKLTIRASMIGTAVMAVAVFGVLRLDIPALPKQTVWGGIRDPGPWRPSMEQLCNTYLIHWVIPLITIAVVWPRRTTSVSWLGIAAIVLTLASWVVLRRLVWPPVMGPSGAMYWPHFHVNYLKESLAMRAFRPPYPVSPFRFEVFYVQKADLLCLLALLIILVIRLIRPLPLRVLVLIALLINLYKLCEWGSLMWHGRYWGSGVPSSNGHSSATQLWVPDGWVVPRASPFELAEGPQMIVVVGYLLFYLLVARRPNEDRISTLRAESPKHLNLSGPAKETLH